MCLLYCFSELSPAIFSSNFECNGITQKGAAASPHLCFFSCPPLVRWPQKTEAPLLLRALAGLAGADEDLRRAALQAWAAAAVRGFGNAFPPPLANLAKL